MRWVVQHLPADEIFFIFLLNIRCCRNERVAFRYKLSAELALRKLQTFLRLVIREFQIDFGRETVALLGRKGVVSGKPETRKFVLNPYVR